MRLDVDLAVEKLEGLAELRRALLDEVDATGLRGDPLLANAASASAWCSPPWWAMASPGAADEWRRSFEVLHSVGVSAGALAVELPAGLERRVLLSLKEAAGVIGAEQERRGTYGYELFGVDRDELRDAVYELLVGASVPQVPSAALYDVDRRREWAEVMARWVALAVVQGAVAVAWELPAETRVEG